VGYEVTAQLLIRCILHSSDTEEIMKVQRDCKSTIHRLQESLWFRRELLHNIVTCRPFSRERGDKHFSLKMDSWKITRYEHISVDMDTLYNRKPRSSQFSSNENGDQTR
jgi:hypothetical protein